MKYGFFKSYKKINFLILIHVGQFNTTHTRRCEFFKIIEEEKFPPGSYSSM